MKRRAAAAVMCVSIAAAGFAQKNMVAGGAGAYVNIPLVAGAEAWVSYERRIIPRLAVGVNLAGQFYPAAIFAIALTADSGKITNIFGYVADAQARWYPFKGAFHLDAGLGLGDFLMSMPCLVITPGLGWKITFGKSPVSLNIGIRGEFYAPLGDSVLRYENTDGEWVDLWPFNLGGRVGLGVSF
ncbi:MAG: hypothetical protein LBG84_04295 [Treponema sp.]|jgi:hypothetical protein|nr:hypothetical protein [Treponema sp.]